MTKVLLSAFLVLGLATAGAQAATHHKKHHMTKMKSSKMMNNGGQSAPPADSTVKSQSGQASPTAGSK